MIFVTVGTDTHPFNRLLKWVDEAIERSIIKENVYAQIGHSTYIPKNYKFKRFYEHEEMEKIVRKADLIISHAGAGTILDVLTKRKKLLIVPRLKKYGEHTDDHQLDLSLLLEKEGKCLVAFTKKDFFENIKNYKKVYKKVKIKKPEGIIKEIKKVLVC